VGFNAVNETMNETAIEFEKPGVVKALGGRSRIRAEGNSCRDRIRGAISRNHLRSMRSRSRRCIDGDRDQAGLQAPSRPNGASFACVRVTRSAVAAGETVLEIGCGTGPATVPFCRGRRRARSGGRGRHIRADAGVRALTRRRESKVPEARRDQLSHGHQPWRCNR
jgi:hypothetical protein